MKMKIGGVVALLAAILVGCNLNSDVSSGQEQLLQDLKSIDSYLSAKGIPALNDVNGIRFTIDSLGSGYPPLFGSSVTFDYTGKLLSGATFQSGTVSDRAISGLITGLQIGLPFIPNGTKATFYIPSIFAYGSQAQSNIPPNSNLIFSVKLKGITITSTEKMQLQSDTAKIGAYLRTAMIANVVTDTSGMSYVITQAGSGINPSWFHRVKLTYTGYLLQNGAKGDKFFEGSSEPSSQFDSRVVGYIRGFQLGLQKLNKGSKATFYLPSGLAFGNQTKTGLVSVPANSNVIYEVELKDVLNP